MFHRNTLSTYYLYVIIISNTNSLVVRLDINLMKCILPMSGNPNTNSKSWNTNLNSIPLATVALDINYLSNE